MSSSTLISSSNARASQEDLVVLDVDIQVKLVMEDIINTLLPSARLTIARARWSFQMKLLISTDDRVCPQRETMTLREGSVEQTRSSAREVQWIKSLTTPKTKIPHLSVASPTKRSKRVTCTPTTAIKTGTT